MRLFITEGDPITEGHIADLWPLVRNARLVANALQAKGLIAFDTYLGDDAGYELKLTPLGRGKLLDLQGVA